MTSFPRMRRIANVMMVLGCVTALAGCQLSMASGGGQQPENPNSAPVPQDGPSLIIQNESDLPDTFPHASYELQFRAHGGVPVLHWRLEKGALPQGLRLEDDGLLHGQAERTGEFQFTISVRDGGKPQQAVQKVFLLHVRSGMTLNWKRAARVSGSRIDGSVEVSNATPDDIDLTFVVLAVAPNGRATAIGYQHFVLRRATVGKELPFGETLPPGEYVVHVDGVGEVASRHLIYREQLQTPSGLQIVAEP